MDLQEEVKKNPLCTRSDCVDLLLALCEPLKKHFSPGCARLLVGWTGAHYGEKAIEMEGFARILWGMGPFFAGGTDWLTERQETEYRFWSRRMKEGICHGTNPLHEEYWGDIYDYDQKMVETAAIVVSLALAKDVLWDSCTAEEQQRIYDWLKQINGHEVHANNWRFFRILTNATFERLGLPADREILEKDLAVIEGCYLKDGWYCDGNRGQMDYYIPFAMHFYGLLYAFLREDTDPKQAEIFKQRAAVFSKEFCYWFGEDGAEVPFGRSLTYRFAHGAFFGVYAFAGADKADGITIPEAKHILLQNLRHWMKQPVFDNDGVLTIGYQYPNLFMSERYNAPGSPYWSFKTFLILAMGEAHPFWQCREEEMEYDTKKLLMVPHMLIRHEAENHVLAYAAGQHCMEHGNSAAKYEKFVYSNKFGFSVSRGHTLEDGAFDNTLAISYAGDNCFRMRFGVSSYKVTKQYLYTKYSMMPGVEVESVMVPLPVWHVRIHKIATVHRIDIADGGFALPAERPFQTVSGAESGKWKGEMVTRKKNAVFAHFPWGSSGVAGDAEGEYELISAYPNTNLMANTTVIPTCRKTLEPGVHITTAAMYADTSLDAQKWSQYVPTVSLQEDVILIQFYEKPEQGRQKELSIYL